MFLFRWIRVGSAIYLNSPRQLMHFGFDRALKMKTSAAARSAKKGDSISQTKFNGATSAAQSPATRSPTRAADGTFHFKDFPQFLPNRSPGEILQAGSFGGTYFRPIHSKVCPNTNFGEEVWKELPEEWTQGLDPATRLCSTVYRASVNKYRVKCGGSLDMWEEKGWIRPQDPYGWFQWCVTIFYAKHVSQS
jgi:hypothetical protein